MSDFDVVVIGGGCAGLWAARTAGSAGARTLLVERSGCIGARVVCAEGVGTAGVGQFVELAPECVAAEIHRALLFDPRGCRVELDEPGCGYVLDKEVFLSSLADMASRSGVRIEVGTEARAVRSNPGDGLVVDLKNAGGCVSVSTGAVVAADGIESGVGRRLGIQGALKPLELFSCAQYRLAPVELDPHTVEFHFGRNVAPGGYAWVFPKGEGVANVGVGVICSGKGKMPPLDYLEEFRRRRCPEARIMSASFGGVPAARAPFKACGQGVFLAGDAARVADPVSGAGIVPGMESAAAAGMAAVAFSACGPGKRSVEREFVRTMKAHFKDRSLRFAVRRILVGMDDDEIVRLLALVGEYASRGSMLGDPFGVVRFMLKGMPQAFRLVRHLVGT